MDRPSYSSALIIGAGSGLSASLARAFSRLGMKIALAARNASKLKPLQDEVGASAFECDAADVSQMRKLFDEASRANGEPDVVVYNASGRLRGPLTSLDPVEVERTIAVFRRLRDGQICPAWPCSKHGAGVVAAGYPCGAFRNRWRHKAAGPRKSVRQTGLYARSRRHCGNIYSRSHAAAQRLDMGGGAKAVGRDFLA